MATVARTPDAELLTRLRRRDRTAWEELYSEYQPRLRGFGYRLSGNVHDADDLVQETFVRAVPRLDKLDPQTADVGAYLFTTMRNLYLKQVEREKRAQPVAEVPQPALLLPTPIEDDPERSTLLGRQQEEVRKANAALQPRQRLVLALRELEDRSYAEIGELVGMKENAVAQLIFRARESMRTELRLLQVDPEQLPEECRRFLPLLAAHLDGQLKGARRDETLAHLDGCERCQTSLADMREASRRYRTLLPPIAADESRAAIDARLTSAGYWDKGSRRFLVGASTKVAVLAVAAVLLGSAGTGVGVALSGSEPATVGTTTTQPTTSTTTETGTGEQSTTETSTEPTTTTEQTTDAVTTDPTAPTTDPGQPPTEPEPTVGPPSEPGPPTETTTPPTPTDTTPPSVKITKAPAATTTSAGAQIGFTAGEKGVTFACKLDAGGFAACSSPVSLLDLAAGTHAFSVRAKDKAGNVSKPVTVAWTFAPPDTTPPVVTIDQAPPASSPSFSASFSFSSNEPGSTFACSLDGASFATCTNPHTFQRLPAGAHTFSVRATDLAGNTGQPAIHKWTIGAPRPDLVITAFSRFSVTVTNRGNGGAGASVLTIPFLGLTFKVPSLLPAGGSATFTWSTCRIGTYVAVADQTQVVVESDEKNNTASRVENCRR